MKNIDSIKLHNVVSLLHVTLGALVCGLSSVILLYLHSYVRGLCRYYIGRSMQRTTIINGTLYWNINFSFKAFKLLISGLKIAN